MHLFEVEYNNKKMNRKNIVILTGAGISAESGVPTFRDSDGLWCNYKVEEICTHDALDWNRPVVIDFYNQRRKQLDEVQPNKAHIELTKLETKYNVNIVTQNVDDLHERAGSSNILHLHGELRKVCCTSHPDDHVFKLETLKHGEKEIWKQGENDKCPICGDLLRPYIVFFNEAVPNIEPAVNLVQKADILIIIGTSLQVYPAASLMYYAKSDSVKYLIDPKAEPSSKVSNLTIIKEKATIGVPQLVDKLLKE